MNNERMNFSSEEELYHHLLPALRSKRKLLVSDGYKTILEEDIWNYMRNKKWNMAYGLEMCDMVDDILNTDNALIVSFIQELLKPSLKDEFELPKLKS